jgi:DNA-binding NarL/FixJ family response regulator
MTIRTVVADDSLIVRAGLTRLLEAGGCRVVAGAADIPTLMRPVALERPDLALVDIRMPPTYTDEGIRAAGDLRRRHPATAVLVVSQYVESAYAIELLAGGQSHVGYLLKDRLLDLATLLAAAWRVLAGETVVDPTPVSSLLDGARGPGSLRALSAREREVLALLAEGLTDRGIAERLTLSPGTVATHIQNIFQRLGIPDTPADNRRVHAVPAYLRAA